MSDPILAALESIDRTLKALLALAQRGATPAEMPVPAIADPADLDHPDADELVKVKPRDWTGDDYRGSRMSSCAPQFLEELAKVYDYFAKRNDEQHAVDSKGRPKSFYDRRTAARARGWASRLRSRAITGAPPGTPVSASEIAWSEKSW